MPLVARYDPHERLTGPPLPHLFQRRTGHRASCDQPTARCGACSTTPSPAPGCATPPGTPLNYTAHDFRRMFATEAVTGGLPVHIAARLLGHQHLTTHPALPGGLPRRPDPHLPRLPRHTAEPPARSEEYREPTPEEWREFQQHFALRKLELGTCARPYGTPLPTRTRLHPLPHAARSIPANAARLVEIIHNLGERITEARHNGWLGEVQGLRTSLDAARKKLVAVDRTSGPRPSVAALGLPVMTHPSRAER